MDLLIDEEAVPIVGRVSSARDAYKSGSTWGLL